MTRRPRRPPRLTRLSVIGAVAAAATLVVGTVMVLIALSVQSDARARVIRQLDPALLHLERLRSSLIDQETGVRGYAVSGAESFLDPYRSGREAERQLTEELHRLVAGTPVEDDPVFDRIEAATGNWHRRIADPVIQSGSNRLAQLVIVQDSVDVFDEVRAAIDEARGLIETERDEAVDSLMTSTRVLTFAIFAALVLVGAVTGYGVWILRRRVARPLAELNQAAGRVADGAFHEPLDVEGTAEVHELAEAVETMRDRILEELATVERTREELDRYATDLARSNRDLEQFAYVASHDLQEPLRKVASFCQLLEQRYGDELDERGRTYIGFAVDGSRRMQLLINGLLQFSRVGRTTEGWEQVDLRGAADEAVENLRPLVEEAGATFDIGDLPTVDGDRSLLVALFQNLFGNSIKYRSGEAPRITVRADLGGDMWRITCADNGIGIEPRFREKVFVIFQRLHGRDEYSGTGIGLALCKKIVEFHGGTIQVDEPETGAGSSISFTLPLEWDRLAPHELGREREPHPHPPGGG